MKVKSESEVTQLLKCKHNPENKPFHRKGDRGSERPDAGLWGVALERPSHMWPCPYAVTPRTTRGRGHVQDYRNLRALDVPCAGYSVQSILT